MVARTLKRALYILIATSGVGLALMALFLLTQTVQKSGDIDRMQEVILWINIIGGALLFALLIGNLGVSIATTARTSRAQNSRRAWLACSWALRCCR